MDSVVALAIIGAALFFVAFLSKRRFGLLGLSLAAGAVLSNLWSQEAGLMVSSIGLIPNGSLADSLALSLVVLMPAIVLLFHSNKYHKMIPRIFGSLCFGLLALAFLINPLGNYFNMNSLEFIKSVQPIIISVGLVIAIIDVFLGKSSEKSSKKSKH